MSDGYGGITYTYGTIEAAAGNIRSFISFMNSELADIEHKLRPLEDWTAKSADAYRAEKQKWQTNAQEIVTLLGQLQTALNSASTRMQEADTAATRMFPG